MLLGGPYTILGPSKIRERVFIILLVIASLATTCSFFPSYLNYLLNLRKPPSLYQMLFYSQKDQAFLWNPLAYGWSNIVYAVILGLIYNLSLLMSTALLLYLGLYRLQQKPSASGVSVNVRFNNFFFSMWEYIIDEFLWIGLIYALNRSWLGLGSKGYTADPLAWYLRTKYLGPFLSNVVAILLVGIKDLQALIEKNTNLLVPFSYYILVLLPSLLDLLIDVLGTRVYASYFLRIPSLRELFAVRGLKREIKVDLGGVLFKIVMVACLNFIPGLSLNLYSGYEGLVDLRVGLKG